MTSLAGKVALVTGATGGIGLITARELAKLGAEVTLVGRNPDKGEAALAEIRAAIPTAKLDILYGDLSSMKDVRRVAAEFKSRHDRLHILVNNAGALFTKRETTVDGYERTFAMNHLAYFLLTQELLTVLKASAPARIVNVASDAHRVGKLRFDDLMSTKSYRGFRVYGTSKLANILFTRELSRKLEGTGVTANAVHPGVVATGFGKNTPGWWARVVGLVAPLMSTPDEGAKTSIFLASDPSVQTVSGEYFEKSKVAKSSRAAQDDEVAKRLWDESSKLVGG